MNRKKFIEKRVYGLISATIVLPAIASCNATKPEDLSPTATSENGTTNGSSSSDCILTPNETSGPFPIKRPADFIINDITADRKGLRLSLDIAIKNKNNAYEPLTGVIVDVWQSDNNNDYSEYSSTVSKDFLSGRQTCDAKEVAKFTSILPG